MNICQEFTVIAYNKCILLYRQYILFYDYLSNLFTFPITSKIYRSPKYFISECVRGKNY